MKVNSKTHGGTLHLCNWISASNLTKQHLQVFWDFSDFRSPLHLIQASPASLSPITPVKPMPMDCLPLDEPLSTTLILKNSDVGASPSSLSDTAGLRSENLRRLKNVHVKVHTQAAKVHRAGSRLLLMLRRRETCEAASGEKEAESVMLGAWRACVCAHLCVSMQERERKREGVAIYNMGIHPPFLYFLPVHSQFRVHTCRFVLGNSNFMPFLVMFNDIHISQCLHSFVLKIQTHLGRIMWDIFWCIHWQDWFIFCWQQWQHKFKMILLRCTNVAAHEKKCIVWLMEKFK